MVGVRGLAACVIVRPSAARAGAAPRAAARDRSAGLADSAGVFTTASG